MSVHFESWVKIEADVRTNVRAKISAASNFFFND
jgi:hypothetical protein